MDETSNPVTAKMPPLFSVVSKSPASACGSDGNSIPVAASAANMTYVTDAMNPGDLGSNFCLAIVSNVMAVRLPVKNIRYAVRYCVRYAVRFCLLYCVRLSVTFVRIDGHF